MLNQLEYKVCSIIDKIYPLSFRINLLVKVLTVEYLVLSPEFVIDLKVFHYLLNLVRKVSDDSLCIIDDMSKAFFSFNDFFF